MGRLIGLWSLIVLAAALSAALLIALEAPGSAPAHWVARLLPVPDVWAADAEHDLQRGSVEPDPQRRAAEFRAAEQCADLALQAAPMRPEGWLRLAYVRGRARGALTPDAIAAFAQSYRVAPVDPRVGLWRIHFGFEAWPTLEPAMHDAVNGELAALWKLSPEGRDKLRQAVDSVDQPAGRAAGRAALAQLGDPVR